MRYSIRTWFANLAILAGALAASKNLVVFFEGGGACWDNLTCTLPSAGGCGASTHFPWVAEAYPNAHVYVLADASQGVTTTAFDVGNPGSSLWSPQLAPSVFGNPPVPGRDTLRIAAQAYPHAKVSQFTAKGDGVQTAFYGVMKQFHRPGGACHSPAVDWTQQMLGTLQSCAADLGNFRYYLADGTYHTMMRSLLVYRESSPGTTYRDWLDAACPADLPVDGRPALAGATPRSSPCALSGFRPATLGPPGLGLAGLGLSRRRKAA